MDHPLLERAIRNRSTDDVLSVLLAGGLGQMAAGASDIQAVRHPLGFTCLPLSRDQAAIGTCVHIWSEKDVATRSTSAVHCHSWDLLSYIVTGCVVNQTYWLREDDGASLRLYEIRSVDGHDEISALPRRADAVPEHRGIHEGGEYYELPAGDFHTSTLLSPDAVTVVVGKPKLRGRDISLGHPDVVPAVKPREQYDAEQTTQIVRRLLARLSVVVPAP